MWHLCGTMIKDTMRQRYLWPLPALLIFCYLTALVMSGCSGSGTKKKVDVSAVEVPFKSIRFDRELLACDTNRLMQTVDSLGNRYPDFASVYFQELTGFAQGEDTVAFLRSLRHFLTYKDYRNLFDTVVKRFPDVKEQDRQLLALFRHIRHYFPEKKLGTVYYFITGLNFWSAVTVDSAVGVGLDMYLGKDYPFYPSVQLPDYQIARCEKEYIPVNVARAIYQDMSPFNAEGKTLLDLMLQRGKEQLFLEYTMPDASEELLMGYTPEQLQWCRDNEGMIWNYFAKEKLLYSTHWQDILRYVNDGPTSTGMPPESPGNIGTFIGWQLARTYLDKHPEAKWNDFVKDTRPAQRILEEAGYKPR